MALKAAPLPEDQKTWGRRRESDLEGGEAERRWNKRAKTLVSAAEHSIGSKEALEAARIELRNLLDDMGAYTSRLGGSGAGGKAGGDSIH